MTSYLNWRYIYFLTIGLRFLFALSDSYIHPDEHFQSVEVMSSLLGYTNQLPWEFTSDNPARSYGPLYLVYGPMFLFLKVTNTQLSPLVIWYLIRLQFMIITWVVVDTCIYSMLPTKQERIKAIFFVLTSYVTHIHQSHCFSNSIETWLVLLGVMLIDNLRYNQDSSRPEIRRRQEYTNMFALGAIMAIGIFNRVTMPAFFLVPSFFVLKHVWNHPLSMLVAVLGFVIPAVSFIYVDTWAFGADFSSPVITPLNNLIYNTSYGNLSQHGIHPLYTHILVNLPQLLGPSGLLYLFWKFKNRYWMTTPFLSACSGIAILSLVPHQEVRFLIPAVPLLICCFDLRALSEQDKVSKFAKPLLWTWYAFNLVLALLMGIYHQGGIVQGIDHIRSQYINQKTESSTTFVWWRTYPPPIWLLGDQNNEVQALEIRDGKLSGTVDKSKKVVFIDAKGLDLKQLSKIFTKGTKIVTPQASFNTELKQLNAKCIWSYAHHLDLDHLDFSNLESLKPGLGIYELL